MNQAPRNLDTPGTQTHWVSHQMEPHSTYIYNHHVTLVTHPKGVNNSYEKKVYKNVFAYYSI